LGVTVLYHDESNGPDGNALKPHINIVNNSGAPLDRSTLEVRYWFTAEATGTLVSECDYAVIDCSNITVAFTDVNPVSDGADTYASITFTAGTIPDGGETARMQFQLHTSGWTNFDQSDDWSYVEGADWIENPNILVYDDGVLVWGCLPEPL
jgi:hypothetical protein